MALPRLTPLALLAVALFAAPVAAQTCTDGVQTSGALYEFCVPPGPAPTTLVVYAHGFIFPQEPLTLPSASGDGASVQGLALSQGLGYAASSYYKNGLVIPELAVEDLREVVDLYEAAHGTPDKIFLVGFSNGALISTVALERFPGEFDGALASCGPLDAYSRNVDYFGDVLVVFEQVLPGALEGILGVPVGGPEGTNPAFLGALVAAAADAGVSPTTFLAGALQGILADPANADGVGQLLGILAATPDIAAAFNDPVEGSTTVISALLFNIFATDDALITLGGNLYDNSTRVYASPFGPDYDAALNATIARFSADPEARMQLADDFETTGILQDPIIALHTTRDGVVPVWQGADFASRVKNRLTFDLRPIERYGHCAFTPEEIGQGFTDIVGTSLPGCDYAFEADAIGSTQLPASGGRIGLAFGIDNSDSDAEANVDVWATIANSDGDVIYVRAPRSVDVPAGGTFSGRFAQRIPGFVADGEYRLTLWVGQFNAENPALSVPCGFESFIITKGDMRPAAKAAPALVSSEWSDLDVTGKVTEAELNGMVRVSPNPTAGEAAFSFALSRESDVSLTLYDVTGRLVMTLQEGAMAGGSHVIDLTTEVPAGVYVWRLSTAETVETGRLTVVR
ncbi:MAG: T9SS type A sorting domain-containing protein [Bacteroidota bacterium]